MIELDVSSVRIRRAPTVAPGTTLVEAARELRRPEAPVLVVLDGAGTVAGVVDESDVVAGVADRGSECEVDAFTSTRVPTTTPETPIVRAAEQMQEEAVTTLPVVDDGEYVGVVTAGTLAPYLSRRSVPVTPTRERFGTRESTKDRVVVSDD